MKALAFGQKIVKTPLLTMNCLLLLVLGFCGAKAENTAQAIAQPEKPFSYYIEGNNALAFLGTERVERVKQENAKEQQFRQKCVQQVKYNVHALGLDAEKLELFFEWTASENNVKQLLKTFIYMASLKEPLCVAVETMQGLSVNAKGEQTMLLARTQKKAGRDWMHSFGSQKREQQQQKSDPFVFHFSDKGVRLAHISEAMECKNSLEAPNQIAKLLLGIAQSFKESEKKADDFFDRLEYLFTHLADPNADFDEQMRALIGEMHAEWKKIKENLKAESLKEKLEKFKDKLDDNLEELGKDIKNVAIWFTKPDHVEDVIEILLYMTALHDPYEISMDVLAIFDLDKLFIKAAEKFGAKLIAKGEDRELVMWWLGPNGLIPLFIRQGEETDEKMPVYQYQNGTVFEHQVDRMDLSDEIAFLRHIGEEIIKRKGHPMQELIGATMHKFAKISETLKGKLKEFFEKLKELLKKVQDLHLSDLRSALKKFAVWFITPDRVNNVINLVLLMTGLDTPIYIGLEILDAFGVTEHILAEFKFEQEKLDKIKAVRENKYLKGSIDFAISKDGLIPMILADGQIEDNDVRENRLSDQGDLLKVFVNVVFKHQKNGLAQLYALLLDKLQTETLMLNLFQRWNKANRDMHTKYKTKYDQFVREQKAKKLREKEEDKFNCITFIQELIGNIFWPKKEAPKAEEPPKNQENASVKVLN